MSCVAPRAAGTLTIGMFDDRDKLVKIVCEVFDLSTEPQVLNVWMVVSADDCSIERKLMR